jgi:hypothetical protein
MASNGTKDEIRHFQNCVLKIIDLDKETATSKYNIIDIVSHIESSRFKQISKILEDPSRAHHYAH